MAKVHCSHISDIIAACRLRWQRPGAVVLLLANISTCEQIANPAVGKTKRQRDILMRSVLIDAGVLRQASLQNTCQNGLPVPCGSTICWACEDDTRAAKWSA